MQVRSDNPGAMAKQAFKFVGILLAASATLGTAIC
jgi:hypothetical protein